MDAVKLKELLVDKGHQVLIYPDASGQNASSKNATESDFSILRDSGFKLMVEKTNPAVMDRVNSANAMILNDLGVRRWKINTTNCPDLTESLEQQVYDKHGAPDKENNHDHAPDAQGYFIYKLFPLTKPHIAQRVHTPHMNR